MPSWPNIKQPSSGLSGSLYKPQIKMEFEANYVQTRPAGSRTRRRFNLKWDALTSADFNTLATFFDTNQGGSFTITAPPPDSTSYTCVFATDEIGFKFNNRTHYFDVTCPIEEL
jgi:hypothetical protein